MGYLETAKRVTYQVDEELTHLPELNDLRSLLYKGCELIPSSETARHIGTLYLKYLRVIRQLATLSESDLALIRQSNALCKERGISSNSASHGGADHFIDVLGPDRMQKLYLAVQATSAPPSDEFSRGLEDLSNRMTLGHTLAQQGETLADGASAQADTAIHGHTKGIQPEAMIHFVMCHFLERVFTAAYANETDPNVKVMISQKDTLLAAMGDVLRLQKAKGTVDAEIIQIWEKDRSNGGLQWNESAKQEVFDEVAKRSIP